MTGSWPRSPAARCAGNGCSILLSQLITLNGDVGTGAGFVPLSLPPPPCLWEPVGNAVSGSNYVLQQFPNPTPDTPFGVLASVRQAKKLLTTRPVPAGTWYVLPINPAAGPAGEQACLRLPLFFFAGPGQALPTSRAWAGAPLPVGLERRASGWSPCPTRPPSSHT